MGYIIHHTIIVNGVEGEHIKKAHKKAKSIFKHLTSNIVNAKMNGGSSFFIAPDESKEGWDESNTQDINRKTYVDYLRMNGYTFVELCFGGDGGENKIINHSY
jgi:hypothetical protein